MVIPRPIEGKYRRLKDIARWILLAILVVIPFVRIGGQALILIDIPARKFHVFGLTIWPQELYFLHLLLLAGGLTLFFVTALLGRLWCGYACPQTVLTEIYDMVGRWIAGAAYNQKRVTKPKWAGIYSAWLVLSLALTFVYLSYFVPYTELATDIAHARFFTKGELGPSAWVITGVCLTLFSFGNAAYFRENVCKLVCPYGRFQTALLDRHSPIVQYDEPRGEDRRQPGQKVGAHSGDCIDCKLCVLVCPTGIDIRDGLQVGCLHCGLCSDACDGVMAKFKKENLIQYRTMAEAEQPGSPRRYLRPRTAIYGALLVVVLGIFGYLLSQRMPMVVDVLRDRGVTGAFIPGIGHQNAYTFKVGNMSDRELRVRIELADGSPYSMIQSTPEHVVQASGYEQIRLLVRHPAVKTPGARSRPVRFRVRSVTDSRYVRDVRSRFLFQ